MKSVSSHAAKKDLLRQKALARRKAMPEIERIEKSLMLADHVDVLPLLSSAVVAGFWPIRDEIDPRPLMDKLRQAGHRLCLPVVTEPHLIFRNLERGAELVSSGFGTMVPGPNAEQLRPDVLLMPLAGFDHSGNRLGYGKGYYDTAIAALQKTGPVLCIGLAFETQEVDLIPAEEHDKPLNGILTENGYRSFK
ncbi:MAG: 5-formyltetrahydrofolate cyclo-ligase [Roseibium sp.]